MCASPLLVYKSLIGELRIVKGGKLGHRADFHAQTGRHANAVQLFNAPDIHDMAGREQLLSHGRQQIGASGKNLDVAAVAGQMADGFLNVARTQEFENRQAQSSPPTFPPWPGRRAGPSSCRSGPCPLNQSDPPSPPTVSG